MSVCAISDSVTHSLSLSLCVCANSEKSEISIWNNGSGIPVEFDSVENKYTPELIFGTLLTSSNYKPKVTGGRNYCYGANLSCVISSALSSAYRLPAVNLRRCSNRFVPIVSLLPL